MAKPRHCRVTARLAIGMALVALGGCTKPPYPRGTVETLYPAPPRPDVRQHPVAGRSLQVVEMPGIEGGTPILFVHGSPGDWQAWARYLDTADLPRAGARRAVDRPGFGGSGPGRVITDLRAQAALLAGLIADDGPPAVVVGHSLGGPLVAWMAIDFPEKVCGAVMVAGSVAPELEAPRWYNRLADTRLARWLLPDALLWSNHEIMSLQAELRLLDAHWPTLQRPLMAVQGMDDALVDPKTLDYLKSRVSAPWLTAVPVFDQGHFVLWKAPASVIDAIVSLPCWP